MASAAGSPSRASSQRARTRTCSAESARDSAPACFGAFTPAMGLAAITPSLASLPNAPESQL